MVLTSKEEFLRDFMKISADLTSAELRMLYMILIEPEVLNLSQEKFAMTIKAHRRTINIGLKKLRELNLIAASVDSPSDVLASESGINHKKILKGDLAHARKYVQRVFNEHYHRNPNDIVVNEDFFSRILGDFGLHKELRYNRDFIIQTIKGFSPDCVFYFDRKRDSYANDEQYFIIIKFNNEVRAARDKGSYHLSTSNILDYFSENYGIHEEVVRSVIKKNFPGLRIAGDRIRIQKPFKAEKIIS